MAKKCRDYISNLNDYLDGELEPELCDEIERHVGQCENCRIMVDTLTKTVKLCRDGQSERLPEKLQKKLQDKLHQQWQKKFGDKS